MPGKGKLSTKRGNKHAGTKPGSWRFLADVAETRGGWIFLGEGCLHPDSVSRSIACHSQSRALPVRQTGSALPSPGQGALFCNPGPRWLAGGFQPCSCSFSTGSRALLASRAGSITAVQPRPLGNARGLLVCHKTTPSHMMEVALLSSPRSLCCL